MFTTTNCRRPSSTPRPILAESMRGAHISTHLIQRGRRPCGVLCFTSVCATVTHPSAERASERERESIGNGTTYGHGCGLASACDSAVDLWRRTSSLLVKCDVAQDAPSILLLASRDRWSDGVGTAVIFAQSGILLEMTNASPAAAVFSWNF